MKIIITNNRKYLSSHNYQDEPESTAVIACTSDPAVAERFGSFPPERTLILSFLDTEEPGHVSAFSEPQACETAAFITKSAASGIKSLTVCCDSGESRSAAIAAAAERSLHPKGGKYRILICPNERYIWENPRCHPNLYVYKLLCDKMKMKTTEFGLRLRKRVNDKALKKAIKKGRNG